MEELDAWVHQQHFDKWSDQYFDTQENRINNALVTQLIIQNTTNNIRQQQQERTTNAVNNLLNGNFRELLKLFRMFSPRESPFQPFFDEF